MAPAALKTRMSKKVAELEPKEMSIVRMPEKPSDTEYLALNNDALDIIRTNLKSQQLTLDLFDIVKSPAGGSTVFAVPGLSGEEPEKELEGIILDFTTPRAYWNTTDPVEGTPPTCMSQNSIISADGKACATCPYNDFGSRDGGSNAKACKESVLLFLLRPNSIIPLLVRVPVSSKGRFLKYSTRLLSTLTPINGVVTSITLQKAVSKTGQPYALYDFNVVRKLESEEVIKAQQYAQQFMEVVNAAQMVPDLTEAG